MVDSKLERSRKRPPTERRYFDEQTKRESIEALLKGAKTRQELCKELDIQPTQLLAWLGQYNERQRAYRAIEHGPTALPALSGAGESLAAAIGAGLTGAVSGGLHDEIARAVGNAVLKLLAEQQK